YCTQKAEPNQRKTCKLFGPHHWNVEHVPCQDLPYAGYQEDQPYRVNDKIEGRHCGPPCPIRYKIAQDQPLTCVLEKGFPDLRLELRAVLLVDRLYRIAKRFDIDIFHNLH